MFKSILTLIGGIEHYGLISLGLFFGVFIAMLIWAFTLKQLTRINNPIEHAFISLLALLTIEKCSGQLTVSTIR